MNIKSKTFSYDIRARIFGLLVAASAVSLLIYVYAVLATVHHTVARENLQTLGAELGAKVSELEFKDIALKNTVNLEVAISHGFSEVTSPLYVSRKGESLTLNTVKR
jgi:hypothetical protein